MSRMTQRNLQNVKNRFSEETGVNLQGGKPRPMVRKTLVLAAVVAAFLVLTAFTWPLFSSLDGDELSLYGTYEGNGMVAVRVENRSDKQLSFQKQAKLMRWVTSAEVPTLGGEIEFENTEFPPHSEGVMRLDLSEAYDVQALEQSSTNAEWFYLVLTNNDFLFGQDWMCSIRFAPPEEVPETVGNPESSAVEPEILEEIREELRFYFEESYENTLMAFNEANFLYQQKVEEVLARFEGKIVPSLSPKIMVGGPTEFLEPEPVLVPAESWQGGAQWRHTDIYGRMVATADEKAWVQEVLLPKKPGRSGGDAALPLVYLFVYPAEEAVPENYAFLYGRILSFGELEDCLVRRDEYYAIYNATGLLYTDLDRYLEDFLRNNPDVYCDEKVRESIRRAYAWYCDPALVAEKMEYLWMTE